MVETRGFIGAVVAADAMAKTADVSQTASVLDQRQITAGGGLYEQSVYTILLKHWESTIQEDIRPLIFLMSE